MEIALSVNGDPIAREVAPQELLLDFLRDSLGLTGAKKSCEVAARTDRQAGDQDGAGTADLHLAGFLGAGESERVP